MFSLGLGYKWWGSGGTPLAVMPSQLTLTRAQAGGAMSTAQASDNVTWVEYAADVARFHGTAQRLLIGGQRTNSVRNPRAEGSTPTNWVIQLGAGVTVTYVGGGRANGIDFAAYEIAGTPSVTTGGFINFETVSGIAAAPGEIWTSSAFIALDPDFANNTAGTNFDMRVFSVGGGDAVGSVFTPTTATLSSQRVATTRTMPASTDAMQPRLRIGVSIGVPVLFRLRIGWPQAEQAAFASNPILPPVGTPGASTRGSDLVSATLASLGLNIPCTILWCGMIPQNASAGADQMLCQIDDGSDNNRYRIRNLAGGSTIVAGRVLAGASADATSLGSMTAGTLFRAGVSIDAAGRIAGSFNGGTVQAATGGPASGLTTLRLGNNAANSAAQFGENKTLIVVPLALSDAELVAQVAALT